MSDLQYAIKRGDIKRVHSIIKQPSNPEEDLAKALKNGYPSLAAAIVETRGLRSDVVLRSIDEVSDHHLLTYLGSLKTSYPHTDHVSEYVAKVIASARDILPEYKKIE